LSELPALSFSSFQQRRVVKRVFSTVFLQRCPWAAPPRFFLSYLCSFVHAAERAAVSFFVCVSFSLLSSRFDHAHVFWSPQSLLVITQARLAVPFSKQQALLSHSLVCARAFLSFTLFQFVFSSYIVVFLLVGFLLWMHRPFPVSLSLCRLVYFFFFRAVNSYFYLLHFRCHVPPSAVGASVWSAAVVSTPLFVFSLCRRSWPWHTTHHRVSSNFSLGFDAPSSYTGLSIPHCVVVLEISRA
jgi:hypothetical protein